MIRLPIVRMILQPPRRSRARSRTPPRHTQAGTSSSGGRFPFATSARKIIPIVFWASFVPWDSENRLAGDDLPEPEPARHRARTLTADDPVGDEDRHARHDEREYRRHQRRDRDLLDDPLADHGLRALGGERGPTTPADQRVRGRRRQPEVPRQEVPGDRPDQAGEDDRRGDEVRLDDARRRSSPPPRARGTRRRSSASAASATATRGDMRGWRSKWPRRWRCRGSRW